MTMHEITPFGRQQTSAPAFWYESEALPFASFRRASGPEHACRAKPHYVRAQPE